MVIGVAFKFLKILDDWTERRKSERIKLTVTSINFNSKIMKPFKLMKSRYRTGKLITKITKKNIQEGNYSMVWDITKCHVTIGNIRNFSMDFVKHLQKCSRSTI